jgi:large subunit ribosomal protein L4
MLDSLKISGKKTLLLTNEHQENVYKSGRNIDKVSILEAQKVSTYDLLNNQVLLLQKSAVDKLVSVFN